MAEYEKVGLQFVEQGAAQFQSSLRAGAKGIDFLQKSAAVASKVLGGLWSVLGNVAQIAGGILARDLLRGVARGVGALFKEAAEGIFGASDALEKLQDSAGKAKEGFPKLMADLAVARIKLAELQSSPDTKGSEIAETIFQIKEMESEVAQTQKTVEEANAAQAKYSASLAGQVETWRGGLVKVAQSLIERYLPTLTSAFQRLAPLATVWLQKFVDFLTRPEFIAAAERLVNWLATELPLALYKVEQAIKPVLDVLFGGGSWQEKLAALGTMIGDWFTGIVPVIQGKLGLWARELTAWITEIGQTLPDMIQNVWGPALTDWISSPETLARAGTMFGEFYGWWLETGFKIQGEIAKALVDIFISVFHANMSVDSAVVPAVTVFLSNFWKAFSDSPFWRGVEQFFLHLWLDIQRGADNAWRQMDQVILSAWYAIQNTVRNAWLRLSDYLRNGYLDLRDTTVDKWNQIRDYLKKVWGDIHFAVLSSYYSLENTLKLAWSRFAGDVRQAWDSIRMAIIDPIQRAIDTVVGVITDPSKRMEFYNAAVNWVQGIISGMGSMAYSLYQKAVELAQRAVQGMKNALGIHSLSSVGLSIGENLGTAVGAGFADSLFGAISQMRAPILEATASLAPPSASMAGAANYNYSSANTYAPSLTINSPAPANIGQSFAMLGALASTP